MKVKPKPWWAEVADVFKSDKEKFARFVAEQAASGRYLQPGDHIEASIRSPEGEIDLGQQKLTVSG